jgi:outer membrane biosynthesis protein TonB
LNLNITAPVEEKLKHDREMLSYFLQQQELWRQKGEVPPDSLGLAIAAFRRLVDPDRVKYLLQKEQKELRLQSEQQQPPQSKKQPSQSKKQSKQQQQLPQSEDQQPLHSGQQPLQSEQQPCSTDASAGVQQQEPSSSPSASSSSTTSTSSKSYDEMDEKELETAWAFEELGKVSF